MNKLMLAFPLSLMESASLRLETLCLMQLRREDDVQLPSPVWTGINACYVSTFSGERMHSTHTHVVDVKKSRHHPIDKSAASGDNLFADRLKRKQQYASQLKRGNARQCAREVIRRIRDEKVDFPLSSHLNQGPPNDPGTGSTDDITLCHEPTDAPT